MSASIAPTSVGMGILPLQFQPGDNVETYGLTGEEVFTVGEPGQLRSMLEGGFANGKNVTVTATTAGGETLQFPVTIRIDTPQGDPVLPARRHLAVCVAAAGGQGVTTAWGSALRLSHARRGATPAVPAVWIEWIEGAPLEPALMDPKAFPGFMGRSCSAAAD